MAATAWKTASTLATVDDHATLDWSDLTVTNLEDTANGDAEFTFVNGSGDNSDTIKATNFGFTSSDVPSGATIDGVEVRTNFDCNQNNRPVFWNDVKLIVGGSVVGTNEATTTQATSGTNIDVIHFGPTNLGGETVTQSDVVATDFGCALQAETDFTSTTLGRRMRLDQLDMRIYYTESATNTAAQTANTPTQAGTGAQDIPGTASSSIGAPTQSASATHTQGTSSTGAQTVNTPTQVGTGAQDIPGTGAQTASTPTQTGLATHDDGGGSGTQSSTIPTQVGVGALSIPATASQIVLTPTQVGTGVQDISGAGAQTASTPSQVGSASLSIPATASQIVLTPTQTATGSESISGTGAHLVGTPTQIGTATSTANLTGTGAHLVPTPTQSATGTSIIAGLQTPDERTHAIVIANRTAAITIQTRTVTVDIN